MDNGFQPDYKAVFDQYGFNDDSIELAIIWAKLAVQFRIEKNVKKLQFLESLRENILFLNTNSSPDFNYPGLYQSGVLMKEPIVLIDQKFIS